MLGVKEHVTQDRHMWRAFIAHPTAILDGKMRTLNENDDDNDKGGSESFSAETEMKLPEMISHTTTHNPSFSAYLNLKLR